MRSQEGDPPAQWASAALEHEGMLRRIEASMGSTGDEQTETMAWKHAEEDTMAVGRIASAVMARAARLQEQQQQRVLGAAEDFLRAMWIQQHGEAAPVKAVKLPRRHVDPRLTRCEFG